MATDLIIPAADWPGSVPGGLYLRTRQGSRWSDAGHYCIRARPLEYDEGIDLSPPPVDADGYPTRVDALPVVQGRLSSLFGRQVGAVVARIHHEHERQNLRHLVSGFDEAHGRRGDCDGWWRAVFAALFAYRGPNGERAWEVRP